MIAADTSAWIDFTRGAVSKAAKTLETALIDGAIVIPMPVLFEILSGPGLTTEAEAAFGSLPRLEILPGYWERAGSLRKKLLKRKLKARSMDCLIAQNCIDHKVGLIATDLDFRHFAPYGLKLL